MAVILGLQKDTGAVVYGSSEIFEAEEEAGADAELAACVNGEAGSFVVGVRLLAAFPEGKIRVHWTALRNCEDMVMEKNEKRIFIKPNLLEMDVRQSHYLEAVCENMVEKAVRWSVKDNGGFIDENGLYTAPNTPGVYEVVPERCFSGNESVHLCGSQGKYAAYGIGKAGYSYDDTDIGKKI